MPQEVVAAGVTALERIGQATNRIFIVLDRMVLPTLVAVVVVDQSIQFLPARVIITPQVGLEK
jgi:hypothetical protein